MLLDMGDVFDNVYALSWQLNDTGFAERFIKLFRDEALYVHGGADEGWYLFRNHVYERDEVQDVLALTTKVASWIQEEYVRRTLGDVTEYQYRQALNKLGSMTTRTNILKAAAVDRRMKVAASQLNQHSELLATPSGVVELTTGRLRDGKPDDYITQRTSIDYDPTILDNPPELVTQFISDFLPEKDRAVLLFRLLGSALYGGNRNRLFTIIKGGTTSGKTMLVTAILNALGAYAAGSQATVFRNNKDDAPRPDVIRLYSRRLAFLAEASKSTWQLHSSRIKLFTGGDQDPQRAMHSNTFYEGAPQCMPVIYTNELPRITGLDEATKRRLVIVTMNHTIPADREDPTIKERFVKDPDVLRWLLAALVRGCVESQRPNAMREVLAAFSETTTAELEGMHHLGDFFTWLQEGDDPILIKVPEDEWQAYGGKSKLVTQRALYDLYVKWVKELGDQRDKNDRLSIKDFNNQLRHNHGFVDVSSGGPRWAGYKIRQPSNVDWLSSRAVSLN